MQTHHRARQAAALEAVKVLHQIGQLNRVLLPVVLEVGAGQREELQQLKEEKDARTEKRKAEYKHHVSLWSLKCCTCSFTASTAQTSQTHTHTERHTHKHIHTHTHTRARAHTDQKGENVLFSALSTYCRFPGYSPPVYLLPDSHVFCTFST